jgi:hypothetical protein
MAADRDVHPLEKIHDHPGLDAELVCQVRYAKFGQTILLQSFDAHPDRPFCPAAPHVPER